MKLEEKNEKPTFEKVWLMFQETDKQMKELREQSKDTDKRMKETDMRMKETDKQIKELGKQIGGLGNSIGNIAEGLSYPSLANALVNQFKVEFVAPNVEKTKGNDYLELDVFAYSNSVKNEAYIVEIKTQLSESAINQLEKSLNKFKYFFPEHSDKKVYGIVCAIKATKKQIEEVQNRGFYFATVKDGFFKKLNYHLRINL